MNTDLSSLARTLAERLDEELTEYGTNAFDEGELAIMEAVIREAIEKTLEEAIAVCNKKNLCVAKRKLWR